MLKTNSPISQKFKDRRDFIPVQNICKFEDPIRNEDAIDWTTFPYYKSMRAIGYRGNQRSDPICHKTLRSRSLIPVMLHIKFDHDWRTSLRDIQVWKFDRTTTDDDGRTVDLRYTISSPHPLQWKSDADKWNVRQAKPIWNVTVWQNVQTASN